MAIENRKIDRPVWEDPIWPDRLPDAETMRILYGAFADELVIRFDSRHYSDAVVSLIATPEDDYASLVVDMKAGGVIGVHVYPLVALAVEHHPSWVAAAKPNPPPRVAPMIVNDIKRLFDRYGLLQDSPT